MAAKQQLSGLYTACMPQTALDGLPGCPRAGASPQRLPSGDPAQNKISILYSVESYKKKFFGPVLGEVKRSMLPFRCREVFISKLQLDEAVVRAKFGLHGGRK